MRRLLLSVEVKGSVLRAQEGLEVKGSIDMLPDDFMQYMPTFILGILVGAFIVAPRLQEPKSD